MNNTGDVHETPEEFDIRTNGHFTGNSYDEDGTLIDQEKQNDNLQPIEQQSAQQSEPQQASTNDRYWSRDNLRDRLERYKRVGRTIAPRAGDLAIRGAKTYLKGSMAIGGAIAGGAISLATTGDLGKTTQSTAAGAATGAALASTGIGLASGSHSLYSNVRDSVREVKDAWYGNDEEHKKEKQEQQIKEYKKNSALRNALSKSFGEEEMEAMMKTGGEVDTYYRFGARDVEELKAMHKTTKKIVQDTGVSIQDAAETTGGLYQLDQDYGNIKDRKKREGAIKNEISSRVKDDRRAEEYTRFAMNNIDALHNFRLHRG